MNRGLLVGINQYPGAPLNGCVNDVTDAAEFLVASCGFQENDLRIITDDRATTDAIKERLRWLIEGAAAGDRLYFHYSGHGTQMAIRNADGGVTSNHDAICPVDFDWSEEHAITDDDFREIFSGVPSEVEFNWVSDSCHSGDLARVMAARRAQGRSYPMNPDMAWRLRTARTLRLKPAGFFRAIEHLNGALISGCRSDQTSADAYIDGRYNGALTYYLLKVLKGSDGLTMPLNALVPQVNSTLATNGYDQEPQLRGNPDILAQSFLASTRSRTATTARVAADSANEVNVVEIKPRNLSYRTLGDLVATTVRDAMENPTNRGNRDCSFSGSISANTSGGVSGSISIGCGRQVNGVNGHRGPAAANVVELKPKNISYKKLGRLVATTVRDAFDSSNGRAVRECSVAGSVSASSGGGVGGSISVGCHF